MKDFILEITREAGIRIKEQFGTAPVKYFKTHETDIVTEADLLANTIITEAIRLKYPTHGIVSEETGEHQKGADVVWIIDPLDGTANFASGIPMFVVMLAVAEKGSVTTTAIYDPMREELAFAQKNQGAFINDQRIFCCQKKMLSESFGCLSSLMNKKQVSLCEMIIEKEKNLWVSCYGCAGYTGMCVASGKRDWLVSFNTRIWDNAPKALLMQEAGCVVTNTRGAPWQMGDDIVAANPRLHRKLIAYLNKVQV